MNTQPKKMAYAPQAPQTIQETGLSKEFLVELTAKIMYRRGVNTLTKIAEVIRLQGPVVMDVIEAMREEKLLATLGQVGGDIKSEMRYELTDKGRVWALEAIARADYAGPAPVTLAQFKDTIKKQAIRNHRITRDKLVSSYGDMVVPDELTDRLGPAVNSGRSILLYGPPGNGKSSLAHCLANAMEDAIYSPFCFEVNGEIVLYYDPTIHKPLEGAEEVDSSTLFSQDAVDQRYIRSLRPSVVTGAELTVDMLDLQFNPTSRTYQAPLHLKAANGVLIIDDLGRQRNTPQQIINRCVVPMEEGVDYLYLNSGLSFQTPFDTLMVFSTNFNPTELVDGAGLRRIYYKIKIDRPDREHFIKIFLRVCKRYGIEPREKEIAFLLNTLYGNSEVQFAGYHAPYLIDQALSMCDFAGEKRDLTADHLSDAWENLYVDENV
jgi:predicted ATPase with chaperone activity